MAETLTKYLPGACPGCGRVRLEIHYVEDGACFGVMCEKCRRSWSLAADDAEFVPAHEWPAWLGEKPENNPFEAFEEHKADG